MINALLTTLLLISIGINYLLLRINLNLNSKIDSILTELKKIGNYYE